MHSWIRYVAALAVLAVAVVLVVPARAGKKDLITQWKCSGFVDCEKAESCLYMGEIVGDKGGDVRRAVLRLIFACAERRGVEPDACRNAGIRCAEIK